MVNSKVAVCVALAFACVVSVSAGSNGGYDAVMPWNIKPSDVQSFLGFYDPANAALSEKQMLRVAAGKIADWAMDVLAVKEHEKVLNPVTATYRRLSEQESLTGPEATMKRLVDAVSEKPGVFLDTLLKEQADSIAAGTFKPIGNNPFPYFGFIPTKRAHLIPDGAVETWSTPCFSSVRAKAVTETDGSVNVTIALTGQKSAGCTDEYIFFTMQGLALHSMSSTDGYHIQWTVPSDSSTAHKWDLATNGIRIYTFNGGILDVILDLLNTVLMFLPETTRDVSTYAAETNVYFMGNYPKVKMTARTIQDVDIDPSTIQSGDFFGIIRLDGLDPMLGWAMGSTTGHTTTAIWDEGKLYVAESTAKDSYWPTNGIQKTEWSVWIEQAREAGFNLVHAPLTPEMAKKYNASAALDFFSTVDGLNYGFYNMLFGWVDTPEDNYPCLPPNYDVCLTWDIVQGLFGAIDTLIPSVVDMLFNQAWNHRLNTTGLNSAEIMYTANQRGIASVDLSPMVEQDTWRYQTTRNGEPATGRSMVCCVFVCHMWKAGGLFDNIDSEVNCGELTNWDDYVLNILDAPTRPDQCVSADPDNQLCQLSGAYTLNLNNYATKTPYAHMAEHCPSEAPLYKKPATC